MAPPFARASATDLAALRIQLSALGGLAEEQLAGSLDAIRRRDIPLAARIISKDVTLDKQETEIEEHALRILAFRQPLAQDLRETVASLKIANTLERVGDLAKSIARRAEIFSTMEPRRAEEGVRRMGQLAQSQLADALNAFATRDTTAALELWRRDVEIDELYNSVFRDLIADMTRNPSVVAYGAQLMFVAKNLERVGDHTTFLAEMTYYVAIGQPLGDERPKGDPLIGNRIGSMQLGGDRRPRR